MKHTDKIDSLDIEIIAELEENGRKSFNEIAANIGKPESTIRTRYNNMVKNDQIRIVPVVRPEVVGLNVQAIVLFKIDLSRLSQTMEQLSLLPEIRFLAYSSGLYDIVCEVYTKNNETLVQFIDQKLSGIEGIMEYDLIIELKNYKDKYDWCSKSRELNY